MPKYKITFVTVETRSILVDSATQQEAETAFHLRVFEDSNLDATNTTLVAVTETDEGIPAYFTLPDEYGVSDFIRNTRRIPFPRRDSGLAQQQPYKPPVAEQVT